MEKIFGVHVGILLAILLSILGLSIVVLASSVLHNKILFKMAVRNIPRRPLQSMLIVTGLMFAAMLLAVSLATGDSLTHSVRSAAVDRLGEVDIEVVNEATDLDMSIAAQVNGGRHSEVIPCLTGNMIWSLIRLGCLSDPRVQLGINWITTYQRFDDAIADPLQGWPYDKYEVCWGKH